MKLEKLSLKISLLALIFIFAQCNEDTFVDDVLVADESAVEMSSKGKPDSTGETFGNNLSFPVIWSDGATKLLRGDMGTVNITGTWWGVWGEDPIDPQAPLYSCGPYIFGETEYCSEAEYKAYIQKDEFNNWQASNWIPDGTTIVDNIDWGDNLESIDWSIRSQIRTEVVLYKNVDPTVTEYAMRHADSWGVDEVHGLQTTLLDEIVYGPGDVATVFTDNARLTIQKLSIENIDELYQLNEQGERIGSNLTWRKGDGWTEASGYEGGDLVNDDPLFNMAVHEASDGPGYYNAEVNVKGKVIFGYTWNAKKLNDGEGYYRVTFSFDDDSGRELKTFFESGITNILLPIEEEEELSAKRIVPTSDEGDDSGEGTRGGDAVIDFDNNLTYMDILIIGKTTGSGGGGGIGGGGGTGGGNTGGGGGGNNGGGTGGGSGTGHN